MQDERGARPLAVAAVLFDLDGTLADSAPDLAHALTEVRARRGLPPVAVESLRPHASSGARGLLGAGMGVTPADAEFAALRDEFLQCYERGLARTTQLFPGVVPMLDAIERRGLAWGIVTNKHSRFTTAVVAALSLSPRAGVVVSGDTTPHAKPHPAPLLHAAQALGVVPEACVYVGDDLRDVEAGRAAGMATIVAGYGYMGQGSDPRQWPATGWIDAPLELLDWLPAASAKGVRTVPG